ncbi:MAG: ABC transporter permease [Octadecabacter sp.]|nr:ABC transporter permease [Octadecabacter sp.]
MTTTEPEALHDPASTPSAGPVHPAKTAFRSITALVLREMSTKYGRSPGGYVWALLEPIGGLMVMTVVFALMLRSPPLGNSFVFFYASGYLVYTLYTSVEGSVNSSVMYSRPLLRYPAVSWIDPLVARLVLNSLTSILILIVVLTGVVKVESINTVFSFGPMLEAVLLAILLGAGIGSLNCVIMGLYPVWSSIWGVLTRPLLLAAGVIFLYEDMPPIAQEILWYTPWIHVTALFRTGLFPSYEPNFITIPLVVAWALIPLFLGLLLLRRHYKRIINR